MYIIFLNGTNLPQGMILNPRNQGRKFCGRINSTLTLSTNSERVWITFNNKKFLSSLYDTYFPLFQSSFCPENTW